MNMKFSTKENGLKKWDKDCKKFVSKLLNAGMDDKNIVVIVGKTSKKEYYHGIFFKQ